MLRNRPQNYPIRVLPSVAHVSFTPDAQNTTYIHDYTLMHNSIRFTRDCDFFLFSCENPREGNDRTPVYGAREKRPYLPFFLQRTSSLAPFYTRIEHFSLARAPLLTAPFTFTRFVVLGTYLFFLPAALSCASFFPRLIFRVRRAPPCLPPSLALRFPLSDRFVLVRVRVRFVTRAIRSSGCSN